MSNWQSSLRSALLGTSRAIMPPENGGDGSPLDRTIAAIGEDSAEIKLLTTAGVLGLYDDIGRLPANIPPVTAGQLSPPQGNINAGIASYISLMLKGRFKDLLPQTLELIAERDLSIPSELLPALLDYSAGSPLNRHVVYKVIGKRGSQLASQNPKWQFAAPDIFTWDGAQRVWKNPKPARRQAFLRQIRHLHPAFALELVQSSWKSEPDHIRHSLLRIFSVGLSADDEPFLEMALDDRSRTVRREAVVLLSSLPNSRLLQRMGNASSRILAWQPENNQLLVRFPVGVSQLLQRDGVPIHIKSKDSARLRAEQLTSMITGTSLNLWQERLGVSIEAILKGLPECRWPRTLFGAFSEAAKRQNNQAWAEALIRYEIKPASVKLFGMLSAERQIALYNIYLPDSDDGDGPVLKKGNSTQSLIYNLTGTLPAEIAAAWINQLEAHFSAESSATGNPMLSNVIRRTAVNCPPEILDQFIAVLQPRVDHPTLRTRLQDSVATARVRKHILTLLD